MSRSPVLALLAAALALCPIPAGAAPKTGAAPPYHPPSLTLAERFPVWLGADGVLDRVVILVEGFDLYNRMDAAGVMSMLAAFVARPLADGLDILVLDFPDSHASPEDLARHVTEAVQAASKATSRPVAVAGLSAGGLAARWALVSAEQQGKALPVNTLFLLDTPNRGARFSPILQAMIRRYGARPDREAITCPAARVLLSEYIHTVEWRRRGVPGAQRRVPIRWTLDRASHESFFSRLRSLNHRSGYPTQCRVVGVSQGTRTGEGTAGDGLFRLWLPLNCGWTGRAEPADVAPGSLLPLLIARQFRVRMPLGIAGSYLRTIPTFIHTESALDAGPGEAPPFDAWFALPEGSARIPHDEISPLAAGFLLEELARLNWGPAPREVGGGL